MSTEKRVTITARWDNAYVPAGIASRRSLLLEIKAPPRLENRPQRPPINLALVIDRSGSMRGDRIEAAKAAAASIAAALTEADRLSVIIFDNLVELLLDGQVMDRAGQRHADAAIARISTRGSTNLSAGWFEGARCVANVLERADFAQGHVLVLSDGCANHGLLDPVELLKHAQELAGRGIKTSAVGIGASYSPLQLDALAEGGQGRLHDAETADDIIDVVLGELGDLHAITARDVTLSLYHPVLAQLDFLTRTSVQHSEGHYRLSLGDIVADGVRPVAVRVELPMLQEGEQVVFELALSWRTAMDGSGRHGLDHRTELQVVPRDRADAAEVNLEVVESVADIWEATLADRAMQHNERRDFALATEIYVDIAPAFCQLVGELPDCERRVERFRAAQSKVSREWRGRSKRQAYSRSKKQMLMEADHRRRESGDWHDHL